MKYKGSLGAAWTAEPIEALDSVDQLRDNYYILALEPRKCLILWDPLEKVPSVDGSLDTTHKRRTMDGIFKDADQMPYVFTTVSNAADLLHCNSSNGNTMFWHGTSKLGALKSNILVDPCGMDVDTALRDMPHLRALLVKACGEPDSTGWTKRINAHSNTRVARDFFDSTPAEAHIGRPVHPTAKEPKKSEVKKVKKRPRPDASDKAPSQTATKRATKEQDGNQDVGQDVNSVAIPTPQSPDQCDQLLEMCDKNFEFVLRAKMAGIRRKHDYLAAYDEATQIRLAHGDDQSWDDNVDRAYSKQVMKAYQLMQDCEKQLGEFHEKAMRVYRRLSPSQKHTKVWSELKKLPAADRPAWMK